MIGPLWIAAIALAGTTPLRLDVLCTDPALCIAIARSAGQQVEGSIAIVRV